QEADQSALQGGKLRLVEPLLRKASCDGPIQHGVQPPERAPSGRPLPDAKGCPGCSQSSGSKSDARHFFTSQVYPTPYTVLMGASRSLARSRRTATDRAFSSTNSPLSHTRSSKSSRGRVRPRFSISRRSSL